MNEQKMKELWAHCQKYIKDQEIICSEATVEDRVMFSSSDFIEGVCNIVGYAEIPEE